VTALAWLLLAGFVVLARWSGRGPPRHRRPAPRPARRVRLPLMGSLAVGFAATAFGSGSHQLVALVLAPLTGLVLHRLQVRRGAGEPADLRAIAVVLDMIASALMGGAPPVSAIAAVSGAIADTDVPQLRVAVAPVRRVGRLLQLGADPATAWAELESQPGYVGASRAARRCATSGARLAGALRSSAAELRMRRLVGALARAERVGVWSLLPLGLCFLPAFVCIGVVPVIAGVAEEIFAGLPG